MTFGQKIRMARKEMKLKQSELGEKVGVKHNSISDWENGKSMPDMDTIELLCGALKLNPSYLMGWGEIEKQIDEQFDYHYETVCEMEKQLIDEVRKMDDDMLEQVVKYAKFLNAEK